MLDSTPVRGVVSNFDADRKNADFVAKNAGEPVFRRGQVSAQRHRRRRRDTKVSSGMLQTTNGHLDLSGRERLAQVVGRAQPYSLGGGGWRRTPTRDHDSNAGVRRLGRSQYIQSVSAGHQDVCHDKPIAIGLALQSANRRVAVGRGGNRELELQQQVDQQLSNILVVIDNQHVHHSEAPVFVISRMLIGPGAVSSNPLDLMA